MPNRPSFPSNPRRRRARSCVAGRVLGVFALAVFVVLVGSSASASAVAASARAGGAPGPSSQEVPVLVSTAWLAERIGAPDLVIVHVGMGRDGTPAEVIPGARWIDYHDFAASERDGLIIEMQPTERIVAALRRVGVSNDSHVVAYGAPGHVPARLFVTLEVLGHERVSVLDGGLQTWRAEGRPLEGAAAMVEPGDFEARPREDILVSADWINERLGDPRVALVDARPAAEFNGSRSPGGVRPGHIPGAYNLYWEELLVSPDEPLLRSLAEVRQRYDDAGARDDGVVVSYCYIGMRASYTYLIARHLGFETRFYDGSWNEWGSRGDLPAERGS